MSTAEQNSSHLLIDDTTIKSVTKNPPGQHYLAFFSSIFNMEHVRRISYELATGSKFRVIIEFLDGATFEQQMGNHHTVMKVMGLINHMLANDLFDMAMTPEFNAAWAKVIEKG